MIVARVKEIDYYETGVRPGGRRPRLASLERQKRKSKRRYEDLIGVGVVITLILGIGMVYLMLVANLTRLDYSLSRATHERAALVDDTLRLDEKLAHLRSQERLASVAAHLGMRDSARFEIVQLPAEPRAHHIQHGGIAFLAGMANWFSSVH